MRRKLMVTALALLLVSGIAFGAALTANRSTAEAVGSQIELGVFTNVHIYAGAIVAVNSSGYAVPAADAANYTVLGRAEEEVDNVGGATDAEQIKVKVGTFRWDNAGDIGDADIGAPCFVVNDQCVSQATNGTYSVIAGVIRWVDAEGVWVDTRQNKWIANGTASTFAVGGNISAGGTLTVTGSGTIRNSLTIQTNLTVSGAATVTGLTTLNGGLTIAKTGGAISFPTNVAWSTIGAATNTISGVGWTQVWVTCNGQVKAATITGNSP